MAIRLDISTIPEIKPHLYRVSERLLGELEGHVTTYLQRHSEVCDLKAVLWGTLSLMRSRSTTLTERDLMELTYLAARTAFFVGELVILDDLVEQYPYSVGARLFGALSLAFQAEVGSAIRQVQLLSITNDEFLQAEKLAISGYLHSMRRKIRPVLRYAREIEVLARKDPLIKEHVLPFILIRKLYLLRSEKSLRGRVTKELKNILPSLEKLRHRFFIAKAHLRLGQLYFNQNELELAFYHYDQSLEYAQLIDSQHLLSIIYNRIGMWYLNQANWEKAKECFEKSLAYAYNSNAEWLSAAPLVNLSQFMWINNQQDEAMQAVENFREIAEKVGDPYDCLTAYNILSQMNEVMGNIELARKYLRKAMSLITELERED